MDRSARTLSKIPDEGLEVAIREELSQPEGALTCEDLAQLTFLSTPDDEDEDYIGVDTLEGLQFAVNLEHLGVTGSFNKLTQLQGLSELREVYFRSSTDQLDIKGLESAQALRKLILYASPVSLRPISNLTNLEELRSNEPIDSDYTPLQNLTNLQRLDLPANDISDLTPLADLTEAYCT